MQHVLDALSEATSASDLKVRVMDHVAEPLGAGATGLYFFGAEGTVTEMHTRGVRDGFNLAYEQLGRGHDPILERAICARKVTHDGDVFRGDGWVRSPLYRACGGPWQIQHYLCAPIVVAGQVVGTLNLGRRSAAHPFRASDASGAARVCQRIAARLRTFAPAVDDVGGRCADRTHIRLHADELEGAAPLASHEAAALWDAVAARHVTPLDVFDRGDRTYVLLPVAAAAAPRALSPREAQIVTRMAAGLATKEIAYELGISLSTVAAALACARKKLGVRSRVQVVEVARRLGLTNG